MARIIYVEDDPLMGDVVKEILSAAGHLIGVVPHGTLGLDTIAFKKPDMVILDLDLPGMNGFEVLAALRQFSATYLTPILVLTAKAEVAVADKAMGAGANSVMTKPFEPDALVQRVADVLRDNSFARAADDPAARIRRR